MPCVDLHDGNAIVGPLRAANWTSFTTTQQWYSFCLDAIALVFFWLYKGSSPADLNFDGITNLADWGILNSLEPSLGVAIAAALHSETTIPQPTGTLLLAGLGSFLLASFR